MSLKSCKKNPKLK